MRASSLLLLNGFMGTGKTTVGKLVADRAGVPFEDLDASIEAVAGCSVAEIFAREGEAGFRRRESEALAQVVGRSGDRVVALGGGALLDRGRRHDALARASVVTLTAGHDVILARTSGASRPLLGDGEDRGARVLRLLAERHEAYLEAHATVRTDELSPSGVADRVLEAWASSRVVVPLGGRTYRVELVTGGERTFDVASSLAPSSVVAVTDANVHAAWGEAFEAALAGAHVRLAHTVVLPPGESTKQLRSVERVLCEALDAGVDRDAVVIGHGGGVVTDIAGFAAATLLRGVRWISVPTTLLAMVDAAVGGKTGVDLGEAKNVIGAFHQPSAVWVDAARVRTESRRGYVSGLAEVVKAACIGDPALIDVLEVDRASVLAREPAAVASIVRRSVGVKAAIVGRDERESGDRAFLNFGHTVGHALEALGGFTRLTHGEGVSLGMVAALRIGVRLGVTPAPLAARLVALLDALGLPIALDAEPLDEALPLVRWDKKRRAGSVRFVLLRGLGEPVLEPLAPAALPELLRP